MSPRTLTIALAGNPNSGKTTIFNNLTGAHQKVGNWSGVTVEKKEGVINRHGYELKIIDLPGTYSLTPFSIEEIVARNFILEAHPDVVIDIIDASNLERSLYLATQLREIDCKILFALNMADMAQSRGVKIHTEKLSDLLDVPIVFTVGNKNEGMDALLKKAIELAEQTHHISEGRKVRYSQDIESAISRLQDFLQKGISSAIPYNDRWTAIKLIEDDKIVRDQVLILAGDSRQTVQHEIQVARQYIMDRFDDDPEIIMTDERYGFIAGIVKETVTTSARQRVDISRNIDRVLTNRFIGFPIFVFFIWAMFQLTFTVGEIPKTWIQSGVSGLSSALELHLSDSLFKDLLLNGVIAGVGSVVVFLPNILILFFCISLFEDTGYMARTAFLMDKIMHMIGLHGKSFIPMLMGFGCNVPAIMATRTLESEKDRILTILITPFMSCSARLPIYIVIAGTFFSGRAGTVIFALYLVGIILSIVTGRLLRSTILKGMDAPFVMELPPYRVPMVKSVMIHMWERSKMFLKKMGNIILIGSVIIWALSAFPRNTPSYSKLSGEIQQLQQKGYEDRQASADDTARSVLEKETTASIESIKRIMKAEKIENSYMGRMGKMIAPVFSPLGIDWRGSVALLSGFVAKEIVVSTMGILYVAEGDKDSEALRTALLSSGMTPLSAISMLVFVLLYLPCLATMAAIRRELRSWTWLLFSIGYSTSLAWVMAFLVFQGGKLLRLGV
ncbi:MAG: ferrous iron transport protein B [Deltaproteobacteria bacterium]|nr:ferrous iron transport protein B [Deltaproteobacteria bacterium]